MRAAYHLFFLCFLTIAPAIGVFGQELLDTLPPASAAQRDSMPVDSIIFTADTIAPIVGNISENGMQDEVTYNADSIEMDMRHRVVYLVDNAEVNYTSLHLTAPFIAFYMDSSIAIAQSMPDSAGKMRYGHFENGPQSFQFDKLRYNFKTSKGVIYEAVTQEGDLYIHGAKTKYIAAGEDTTEVFADEDKIYNKSALITTCDLDVPHYGIRASKIKVVPDRLAVIGASNVEINGVPTPLWLPFGFFPVTSGRRSGLIFPTNYEYSENWGFGLRDVGYYIPVSEYMDLKVLGDIYFNGSWGLKAQSSYRKRYQYNGSISLGYSKRITERANDFREDKVSSYSIRVSHNQDPKAHPYSKLGGSINIQTQNYNALNYNDANSVLQSTYSSNFNWTRTFPDKPFSLSVGMNHSQNTRSGQVTINAPNIDFRMNRIYPLKGRNSVGKEKWFEKISLQYSGNSRTRFVAIDSTLFTKMTWENKQFGVQHSANSNMSFDVLNYLHVTPSVSYDETWFFKTNDREFFFDEEEFIELDTVYNPMDSTDFEIIRDTISYGMVRDSAVSGFVPFRRFNTGVSVNTQIFGTIESSKGWFRGIRHIMKPTISFFYEPATSDRYIDSVQTDIRPNVPYSDYSIFQSGLYSASLVDEDRMTLNYSFNNIFEAKFWSERDSAEKRVKLFDNIVVGGNINLSADTLKFSPVDIRGTTRLFKGATTVNLSARFDPYEEDENGRRINTFVLDTRKKLARFDFAQARFSTRFTLGQILDLFVAEKDRGDTGKEDETEDEEIPQGRESRSGSGANRGKQAETGGFLDLFREFSISHNMVVSSMARQDGSVLTQVNTNSINMTGNMPLTKNWSIRVGNIGYDFQQKRLTYPDLGFSRNLHCWTMSFSWQPQRGTYLFHIGVNPGSLDFLKVPYTKNNADSFGGF